MKRVLITGGAGFIGSHLADELRIRGYRVRVLDNLCSQVHGEHARRPQYLADDIELHVGDIRNSETVRKALEGVSFVFHFAAMVGVGQSMYEIAEYTSVNNLGTAVLLEELIKHKVERLIVASSMSIYGEGLYADATGDTKTATDRTSEQLRRGDFEIQDESGRALLPLPTPETKPPGLCSVYALSKYDQERLCLTVGGAYQIPTVALRFFNVYGPRQALSNPYTGVLAIFASRLLNRNAPLIFEDGRQRRDFVSVHDVARACVLSLESPNAPGQVFNIGSGQSRTVLEVAHAMSSVLNIPIAPIITSKYRSGDIRHCFADISRARQVLGYEPQTSFAEGLTELATWLDRQTAVDRVTEARAELEMRGLTI